MANLTPNIQDKLQNILQYYTTYRKEHYDDNIGIAIENQRREEKQKEIHKELQKLQEVRTTEKYIELKDEKYKIYQQIKKTYGKDTIGPNSKKNKEDKINSLCNLLEIIENKQLHLIDSEGVNRKFLEDHNINVITKLL